MADLQREVSRAFVAVLYHQARLKVFQERVSQRQDEKKDAEDLFEAGMVTHLDVREATLNLHMGQDDLRAGETEHHTALVDFNVILGGDAKKELVQPQGKLARSATLWEDVKRLGRLYEEKKQIDMQRAAKQLATSHKHLGMVKGEMLPTLALVAGGDHGGEKQSDFESSWYFGARMTWQLLDGGTRGADIALAQARIRSDRASLNQVARTLSGTLNKLNIEVDRLGKRIKLQEKNLGLSHENYQDARAIYGAGTMTLTRMGEFNLLYAEARFNLLRLYYLENLIAMDVTALIQGNHDRKFPPGAS
jgi:outer membrane protein TolC